MNLYSFLSVTLYLVYGQDRVEWMSIPSDAMSQYYYDPNLGCFEPDAAEEDFKTYLQICQTIHPDAFPASIKNAQIASELANIVIAGVQPTDTPPNPLPSAAACMVSSGGSAYIGFGGKIDVALTPPSKLTPIGESIKSGIGASSQVLLEDDRWFNGDPYTPMSFVWELGAPFDFGGRDEDLLLYLKADDGTIRNSAVMSAGLICQRDIPNSCRPGGRNGAVTSDCFANSYCALLGDTTDNVLIDTNPRIRDPAGCDKVCTKTQGCRSWSFVEPDSAPVLVGEIVLDGGECIMFDHQCGYTPKVGISSGFNEKVTFDRLGGNGDDILIGREILESIFELVLPPSPLIVGRPLIDFTPEQLRLAKIDEERRLEAIRMAAEEQRELEQRKLDIMEAERRLDEERKVDVAEQQRRAEEQRKLEAIAERDGSN